MKRTTITAAAVAMLIGTAAHAERAEQSLGFYVDPQVGMAHRHIDDLGTWNVLAYGFSVGYQLTHYIGIEGGYLGTGKISETVGSAAYSDKVTGFLGSVVGLGPMDDRWALIGKLGAIHYKEKAHASNGSTSASASATDDKFFVSAGVLADYDGGQVTLELGRALGVKGASVTTLLFGVRWFTGDRREF